MKQSTNILYFIKNTAKLYSNKGLIRSGVKTMVVNNISSTYYKVECSQKTSYPAI